MKKYSHLIILFLLVVLIIAGVLGMYFLNQRVQNALNVQERMKLEQEIQRNQIKNLPELAGRYHSIVENEQYFSLVYSEDRVVDIIKDMEQIAKDENIVLTITQKETLQKKAVKKDVGTDGDAKEDIQGKAPKELVDTLPYEKNIQLELKAEGEYSDFRKFLQAIETTPYALDVLAITGNLAPEEDENRTTPTLQTGSPFLLSNTEVESVPTIPTNTSKTVFVVDIALYVQ